MWQFCISIPYPWRNLSKNWQNKSSIVWVVTSYSRLLLAFLFGPEDGGDMLLRNVAVCPTCTAVRLTVIPVRTSNSTTWRSSGLNFLHYLYMKFLFRGTGIDCAYECFNSTSSCSVIAQPVSFTDLFLWWRLATTGSWPYLEQRAVCINCPSRNVHNDTKHRQFL
jgi:hypothetical protein